MNVYLTEKERKFVADAAQVFGTTEAYVVRLIIRDMAGLPIGGSGRTEIAYLAKNRSGHVQNLTPVRQ